MTAGTIGDQPSEAPTPSSAGPGIVEPGTAELVAVRVREIAEASPDHVYQQPAGTMSCRYVDPWTGQGSCIVGRALIDLGMGDLIVEGKGASYVVSRAGFLLRTETEIWLDRVQANQDQGVPWGQTIKNADAGIVENVQKP